MTERTINHSEATIYGIPVGEYDKLLRMMIQANKYGFMCEVEEFIRVKSRCALLSEVDAQIAELMFKREGLLK